MRFEKSIDIGAPPQRVWDVVSDLPAWPQRIETVETVELLTPAPLTVGSRLRLKQPKLSPRRARRGPGTSFHMSVPMSWSMRLLWSARRRACRAWWRYPVARRSGP